jgi:hypothetical protein
MRDGLDGREHRFPGAANLPAITSKIILSEMSVPQNPVRPVDERREYPA